MKKGEICEGIVERVNYPNRGIVCCGEFRIMVKNVLPGQRVRIAISKSGRDRLEGRLLEVLEKSKLETGKTCGQFGICGGCTYLSLEYEAQKRIKEEQVKSALDRALADQSIPYIWEGVQESPLRYEYRNKMEFTFGNAYKDGPLTLGMHKRGSFYDVVPVEDCLLIDGDYRAILKFVRSYFAQKGTSFFHRMTHEGYLRHLLVRKSRAEGSILVALVTTTQMEEGVERELLKGFLEGLLLIEREGKLKGRFAGILHILNDSPADVVKSDRTDILYGTDGFGEKILGLHFQVSTFSFFQTNSAGAELIYQTVQRYVAESSRKAMETKTARENMAGTEMSRAEMTGTDMAGTDNPWAATDEGKKPVVFDLYSGTGTITQLMAPVADKVIGVEIVEEAVEAARRSAKANHLENCEFIAGDVLRVLDELDDRPDFIILDPPREGIHPKALPKILDYGVDHLVYVSCKLSSLINDLKTFRARGYEVVRATAVDQFPWTANVETVCLLSKLSEAKHHIEVKVDMDELDLTSAETKATYKEIQDWVQEKYGFHVTNLNIAQVKLKHGIIERENYNKPKSPDSKQPGCPEETEKRPKEYTKKAAIE